MRSRVYAISLYRGDLSIYGGSRGQKETFVRGNGAPHDLWEYAFRLSFYYCGAAVVISSAIAIVDTGVCKSFLLVGTGFFLPSPLI